MSAFLDYVIGIIDAQEKTGACIYHTGSPIFDLLLTLYIALSCLIYDELTPYDIVAGLNPDDMVIYDSEKQKTCAEFIGITDSGSIKIKYGEQGRTKSPIIHTVPPSFFYKIKLSMGDATTLDGRGIRTDTIAQIDFLQSVFGMSKSEIPGTNRKSAVIVCGRDFADSFVSGIRIRYGTSKHIGITDIISANINQVLKTLKSLDINLSYYEQAISVRITSSPR